MNNTKKIVTFAVLSAMPIIANAGFMAYYPLEVKKGGTLPDGSINMGNGNGTPTDPTDTPDPTDPETPPDGGDEGEDDPLSTKIVIKIGINGCKEAYDWGWFTEQEQDWSCTLYVGRVGQQEVFPKLSSSNLFRLDRSDSVNGAIEPWPQNATTIKSSKGGSCSITSNDGDQVICEGQTLLNFMTTNENELITFTVK